MLHLRIDLTSSGGKIHHVLHAILHAVLHAGVQLTLYSIKKSLSEEDCTGEQSLLASELMATATQPRWAGSALRKQHLLQVLRHP